MGYFCHKFDFRGTYFWSPLNFGTERHLPPPPSLLFQSGGFIPFGGSSGILVSAHWQICIWQLVLVLTLAVYWRLHCIALYQLVFIPHSAVQNGPLNKTYPTHHRTDTVPPSALSYVYVCSSFSIVSSILDCDELYITLTILMPCISQRLFCGQYA